MKTERSEDHFIVKMDIFVSKMRKSVN